MKISVTKIKKYSKKNIKQLDEELWRVFSLWIRQKDADHRGMVMCVTCGTVRNWRNLDAGHYVSRRHKATKFVEMNVHPQCKICNGEGTGERFKMSQYINRKYGFGMAQKLDRDSKKICHWTRIDYIEHIEKYLDKLKKNKFLTR